MGSRNGVAGDGERSRLVLIGVLCGMVGVGVAAAGMAETPPEPAAEGAPGIALRTGVLEVEQILDPSGRVERRLVPALDLVAGDELRYAIVVRNQSGQRIDAGRVQVSVPVPSGTRFLPGSAGGAGALVEYAVFDGPFSIDLPELVSGPEDPVPGPALDEPDAEPDALPAADGSDAVALAPESSELPAVPASDSAGALPSDAVGAAVPAEATEQQPDPERAESPGPATAPDPLTIRWTYQQPLEPGAETELFFHVRLE